MRNNKKGVELALNAIIIVAILLVAAFVILYIFVGRTGQTGKTLDSCAFKGGTCTAESCPADQKLDGTCAKASDGTDRTCCLSVGTKTTGSS